MNYASNKKNSAILVFAKSAALEGNTKKIGKSRDKNYLIWSALNKKVIAISHKSNIPYFVYDELVQKGATFGEKISEAIQSIYAKGFDSVIVLGNDCLELQLTHLQLAHSKLQDNDFVVGPDYNGGAYLIGISKQVFQRTAFENIKWQTQFALQSLVAYCDSTTTFLLPQLYDVNDTATFQRVLNTLGFKTRLKIYLQTLLYQEQESYFFLQSVLISFNNSFVKYRGPPQLIY